jgi:hypothetical protein
VLAWGNPNPHRFVTEVDPDSNAGFQRYRHVVRIERPLPSGDLSVILGDCVHNYRCVLDHLIWDLSVRHSRGQPVRPTSIGFPISGDATKYTRQGLHAVAPAVAAEVERLQPYHSGQNTRSHPLWMLRELSNIDKHRSIHIVNHHARTVHVSVTPQIRGTQIDIAGPGPLYDGAVIARISIPRPLWHGKDVAVRARTEHSIAIAETVRTPLAHLGMTVAGINDAVEDTAHRLGGF